MEQASTLLKIQYWKCNFKNKIIIILPLQKVTAISCLKKNKKQSILKISTRKISCVVKSKFDSDGNLIGGLKLGERGIQGHDAVKCLCRNFNVCRISSKFWTKIYERTSDPVLMSTYKALPT